MRREAFYRLREDADHAEHAPRRRERARGADRRDGLRRHEDRARRRPQRRTHVRRRLQRGRRGEREQKHGGRREPRHRPSFDEVGSRRDTPLCAFALESGSPPPSSSLRRQVDGDAVAAEHRRLSAEANVQQLLELQRAAERAARDEMPAFDMMAQSNVMAAFEALPDD